MENRNYVYVDCSLSVVLGTGGLTDRSKDTSSHTQTWKEHDLDHRSCEVALRLAERRPL